MTKSFNETTIIRSKGRFAGVHRKESGVVKLGVLHSESAGLSLEELVDLECRRTGEGIRPFMEQSVVDFETDGGRALYRRCLDSQLNPDTIYEQSPSGGRFSDFTSGQYDQLSALGYEKPSQLPPRYSYGTENIVHVLKHGISPERFELLDASNTVHRASTSGWEANSRFYGDLDELRDALNVEGTAIGKYRALVTIGHPERNDRIDEALNAGLRDKRMIEADDYAVADLTAIQEAVPKSMKDFPSVTRFLERGITPAHLSKFGTTAADSFTGAQLDETKLPAPILRSLLAARRNAKLDELETLSAGGFVKGADLKAATVAMGDGASVKDLVSARRWATGEQLSRYKAASPREYRLTVADAKAVGVLNKHGYPDHESLRPLTAGIHKPANRGSLSAGEKSPIEVFAGLVETGATPEQIRAMTRAGISVVSIGEHLKAKDYWVAGAPYRERFDGDGKRQAEYGWVREAEPWVFTEENYLG